MNETKSTLLIKIGGAVEFRSVVDAVRCAIDRLPNRYSFGRRVEESDGDLMGDGVNIAVRLEGVAKPGAICFSEEAYRQVKGADRSRSQRSRHDPTQEHC